MMLERPKQDAHQKDACCSILHSHTHLHQGQRGWGLGGIDLEHLIARGREGCGLRTPSRGHVSHGHIGAREGDGCVVETEIVALAALEPRCRYDLVERQLVGTDAARRIASEW